MHRLGVFLDPLRRRRLCQRRCTLAAAGSDVLYERTGLDRPAEGLRGWPEVQLLAVLMGWMKNHLIPTLVAEIPDTCGLVRSALERIYTYEQFLEALPVVPRGSRTLEGQSVARGLSRFQWSFYSCIPLDFEMTRRGRSCPEKQSTWTDPDEEVQVRPMDRGAYGAGVSPPSLANPERTLAHGGNRVPLPELHGRNRVRRCVCSSTMLGRVSPDESQSHSNRTLFCCGTPKGIRKRVALDIWTVRRPQGTCTIKQLAV
jgi:hypothetical protein